MKTRKGLGEGGKTYLYVYSVKKIARFFKQQIEFFPISCFAVAKSLFIKRASKIKNIITCLVYKVLPQKKYYLITKNNAY